MVALNIMYRRGSSRTVYAVPKPKSVAVKMRVEAKQVLDKTFRLLGTGKDVREISDQKDGAIHRTSVNGLIWYQKRSF